MTTGSSPTFVGLTLSYNNWLKTTNMNLIRETYFGYSTTYRALQLGVLASTKGIAIGIDPTTISGGAFGGNEIALPNVVEIMQANSGSTDWIQNVLTFNNGAVIVGDHGAETTDMLSNVVYHTSACPAASTTTIGTICVIY